MNKFEQLSHREKPENIPGKREQFLYPERPFEHVDRIVLEIMGLESGKIEKINLSEKEESLLLDFEKKFGEQLEKTYEMTGRSAEIYLDYFTTEEGKKQLKELTGIGIGTTNQNEIENIVYENSALISAADPKMRNKFSGDSALYADRLFQEKLLANVNKNGDLQTDGLIIPKRIRLITNPETALEKTKQLREFKNNILRENMRRLGERNTAEMSELEKAKLEILKMFRRKVNFMITDMYQFGFMTAQKAAKIGTVNLTHAEKELLKQFPGACGKSPDLVHSRIDKLRHGASRDGYDEEGWRVQIPPSLKKYAEKIADLGEKIEMEKSDILKKRGLDEKKIEARNITSEQRIPWAERIIREHGLLSSYSADTYDPERNVPAPDNKWQCVPLPTDGLNVDEKKKILEDPALISDMIIERAMTVQCGHEIVHILQRENQEQIPFRIMKKVGGSRFGVFSEAGAMYVQDHLSQKIFGLERPPLPHYTRAMLRKLEGGDYLDCTATYFEGLIKAKKQMFLENKIDEPAFREEIKKNLLSALRSAKRLFSNGTSFESRERYLTNSESTVYLEQRYCTEKLESAGLSKIIYMSGLGLDDIVSLIKLKKLNMENILEYKYEPVLKLWDELKQDYLLKESA